MKVFVNNEIVDQKNAEEIFEPGFLFGWGAFEPLRVYQGHIPFLSEHVKRLNQTLVYLGIAEVKDDFSQKIEVLLKENNLRDAYVRITAYKKRTGTGVIVYASKFEYYPDSVYEKGFSAIISPYRRQRDNMFARLKSLSYLENRMSWLAAQNLQKDEAVILNDRGFIAGGSRSNLFVVKNGTVITPPLEDGAVEGITRKAVKDILQKLSIPVQETSFTREMLFSCDEAFLTSALLEVMPLVECEGKKTGKEKKIVSQILLQYRNLVREKSV